MAIDWQLERNAACASADTIEVSPYRGVPGGSVAAAKLACEQRADCGGVYAPCCASTRVAGGRTYDNIATLCNFNARVPDKASFSCGLGCVYVKPGGPPAAGGVDDGEGSSVAVVLVILGVLALAVVGWWCIRGANKDRQAHMVTQPSGSPGVDRTSVDAGAGAPEATAKAQSLFRTTGNGLYLESDWPALRAEFMRQARGGKLPRIGTGEHGPNVLVAHGKNSLFNPSPPMDLGLFRGAIEPDRFTQIVDALNLACAHAHIGLPIHCGKAGLPHRWTKCRHAVEAELDRQNDALEAEDSLCEFSMDQGDVHVRVTKVERTGKTARVGGARRNGRRGGRRALHKTTTMHSQDCTLFLLLPLPGDELHAPPPAFAPQPATAPPPGGGGSDIASQLQQLQILKNQGTLSEDEFTQAKARLLAAP